MNMAVDKAQFLANRKKGIGGSDLAAILGLSPYKTSYQLWLDKTNRSEKKERDSEAAHFGHVLEDVVAKEFSRRSGMKVQRITYQLSHPDHDWAIGNIDRGIINPDIAGRIYRNKSGQLTTNRLLECKTAGEYMNKLWGEQDGENVPDYYLTQCMWYMGITGAVECYLAVLIGGNKFRYYLIKFDQELFDMLLSHAKDFWFNYVLADLPPDPSSMDDVLHRWSIHAPGKQFEASPVLVTKLKRYQEVSKLIKVSEEEKEALKLEIVSSMKDAESLVSQGKSIATFKQQSSSRFDKTAFEEAHPDLAGQFVKTSSTRVFRVSAKFN